MTIVDDDEALTTSQKFGRFLKTLHTRHPDGSPITWAQIQDQEPWPTYPDDDAPPRRNARQRSVPDGLRTKPLRLLSPEECALEEPRGYLIKGLIAPADLVLLFGQPGAGKSVIAPYLGYAVARGASVFGRRVRQGLVFYCAAEDPHGMRQRINALRLERGDAPDFMIVDGVSDLLSPDSPDIEALRGMVGDYLPALVIVDTVAAAFPSLRENEAEGMACVVRLARSLTDTGAAVVLVHHSPKADDATPRGHGILHGDADVGLRLSRNGGEVAVTFSKNRNGPSDAVLGFTIKAASLGTDEDGDEITAPVLEEQATSQPTKRALTPLEANARGYLADAIARDGKPLPAGSDFPQGLRGVSEDAWRDECEARRLSTADNEYDRARSFRRAYRQLLDKQHVGSRNGLVWLTSPEAARLSSDTETD